MIAGQPFLLSAPKCLQARIGQFQALRAHNATLKVGQNSYVFGNGRIHRLWRVGHGTEVKNPPCFRQCSLTSIDCDMKRMCVSKTNYFPINKSGMPRDAVRCGLCKAQPKGTPFSGETPCVQAQPP